jgi:hypothetical protein
MFAHSADPMDAEDWLRTVEWELHTAQCNDREKVLYVSHPILEGKPNANHVRARIRNSCTQ